MTAVLRELLLTGVSFGDIGKRDDELLDLTVSGDRRGIDFMSIVADWMSKCHRICNRLTHGDTFPIRAGDRSGILVAECLLWGLPDKFRLCKSGKLKHP